MTDRFDFQRGLDDAADGAAMTARERLESERENERAREKRLIKLSVGYYFDPVEKAVLRKVGSRFIFIRHDRRKKGSREDRKTLAQAEARQFRMIAGGLFWDEKGRKLYRKSGQHFVLYSPDRRKAGSKNPVVRERRTFKR